MYPAIAWLSLGKLHVKLRSGEAQRVDSPFGERWSSGEREARQRKIEEISGLLAENERAFVESISAPAAAEMGGYQCVAFTRSARPGFVTQVLHLGEVGAALELQLHGFAERRLRHERGHLLLALDCHPESGRMVGVLPARNGAAHLVELNEDTEFRRQLTEGDCHDGCPSWARDGESIVYQSSGMARDQQGQVCGIGAAEIMELNLATSEVRALRAVPGFDLLLPHRDHEGNLYCIMRPCASHPPSGVLSDLLNLPLFLAKLLASISGGVMRGLALALALRSDLARRTLGPWLVRENRELQRRFVSIRGRTLRVGKTAGARRSFLPRDWRLVRMPEGDGVEETIAEGVAAYDLDRGGNIVYTDGMTIWYRRNDSGECIPIATGEAISELIFVEDQQVEYSQGGLP